MAVRRAVQAWERNAEAWTRHVRDGHDVWREKLIVPALLRVAGDLAGLRVLDAGCGEGFVARMLASRGAKVVGVDAAGGLVERAREEEARHPLGIEYLRADLGGAHSLGRRRFDLVVCCQTLMAMAEYRGAIAEFRRVMTSRGRLLAVINHPCFVLPRRRDYFKRSTVWWRFYKGQPAKTAVFHRPIEDYVSALGDAGLGITRLIEPRPTPAAVRRHPVLREAADMAAVLLLEARRVPA